jgi:hypothetical protein
MTLPLAFTDGEWASIASAAFTFLAASAAFASVARVERDRWRRTVPEFHIELLADLPKEEMRLTVANLGGPAREVRVMGTVGDFGWFSNTPPTSYWRPGESRTFRISMPVITDQEGQTFVEGRDLGKKQLVLSTWGGKSYRWPLRKAEKLSPSEEWHRIFPDKPAPLDVKYFPIAIELDERNL